MDRIKPYPSTVDSGVSWLGNIPKQWDCKHGFIAYREKQEKNKGLIENTVLSLSYGRIVIKPTEKLHGLVPESFETYQIVNPGDIIIRPTDLQNDWNSLRVGLAQNRGIITSAYLCLRTTGLLSPEYGYYLLHTYDLKKIFYGLGSGLRQNLGFEDFKRMPVIIPPKDEQSAIVRFLKHINRQCDRYIREKKKLIGLLNEQKQAIIHQAVTRGLNPNVKLKPSGIPWLGDIPAHWKFLKLRRYCKVFAGATPSRNVSYYWGNGTIPWLSSGDVNQRRIKSASQFITEEGFANSSTKWIKPKSLVVALAGQGRTKGLVATVEFKTTCNQSLAAIEPDTAKIEYRFLAYYLESRYLDIRGLVGDGLRDGLNLELIKAITIPMPSVEEQLGISRLLDAQTQAIDTSVKIVSREIDLIKEYRTSLIADVVTGKLDVRKAAADLPDESIEQIEEGINVAESEIDTAENAEVAA